MDDDPPCSESLLSQKNPVGTRSDSELETVLASGKVGEDYDFEQGSQDVNVNTQASTQDCPGSSDIQTQMAETGQGLEAAKTKEQAEQAVKQRQLDAEKKTRQKIQEEKVIPV